jgi:hypothetical protein
MLAQEMGVSTAPIESAKPFLRGDPRKAGKTAHLSI